MYYLYGWVHYARSRVLFADLLIILCLVFQQFEHFSVLFYCNPFLRVVSYFDAYSFHFELSQTPELFGPTVRDVWSEYRGISSSANLILELSVRRVILINLGRCARLNCILLSVSRHNINNEFINFHHENPQFLVVYATPYRNFSYHSLPIKSVRGWWLMLLNYWHFVDHFCKQAIVRIQETTPIDLR